MGRMSLYKWMGGALILLTACGVGLYYLGVIPYTPLYKPIKELQSKNETDLSRQMAGEFEGLDDEKGAVKVRGYDGKMYYFGVPKSLIENNDADIMLPMGSKVEVSWQDERTIEQILTGYQEDPARALNQDVGSFRIRAK